MMTSMLVENVYPMIPSCPASLRSFQFHALTKVHEKWGRGTPPNACIYNGNASWGMRSSVNRGKGVDVGSQARLYICDRHVSFSSIDRLGRECQCICEHGLVHIRASVQ